MNEYFYMFIRICVAAVIYIRICVLENSMLVIIAGVSLKTGSSIDERPVVVDLKNRTGYWEVVTVAGRQTVPRLVTLVDQTSRFTLVGLAKNKSAESVMYTILDLIEGYHDQVKTIIYDNGKEFSGHEKIAE